MKQKIIDLKEQRKQIIADREKEEKEYYKIRREKQDQVNALDKKISEIEAATKLNTISYKDNIFTYNGETHIIKKERIESIKQFSSYVYITYKPIGSSRVNTINIDTGTEEQTDIAYKTIRKTLLGV